jgi:hypothetical protein
MVTGHGHMKIRINFLKLKEVAELKAKGIEFEEYSTQQLKSVNSIADVNSIAEYGVLKGAWFNDTEGNNIEIAQVMKEQ